MIISISPWVRSALKILALATSTMHYFAIVIMLPIFIQQEYYDSISAFEVAVMITGQTAGFIFGLNSIEFLVRRLGIMPVLNIGFGLLTISSLALWQCAI